MNNIMKQKGFALIEVIVIIVTIMILAAVAIPTFQGVKQGTVSVGINGVTESRCIEGYKFILDNTGNSRQILDEFGKGVRCDGFQSTAK